MGIILKKEHVERVVELLRVTDRIICLKMELGSVVLNLISAYEPQVGCIRKESEEWKRYQRIKELWWEQT